jgi:hypothetical protein
MHDIVAENQSIHLAREEGVEGVVGVVTIGPLRLNDVLRTTGTPVASPKRRISS